MFRASVPIIRNYKLYTWQLVRFMQVIWPLPSRVMLEPDPARKWSHNLHETYQLPSVQYITPDDGHRRCPKHAEFYEKIKFWIFDASRWLFYMKIYMSVSPHGTIQLPVEGFSCISTFEDRLKICRENFEVRLKSAENNRYFTWRPVYFYISVNSEWCPAAMTRTYDGQVCRKVNTPCDHHRHDITKRTVTIKWKTSLVMTQVRDQDVINV